MADEKQKTGEGSPGKTEQGVEQTTEEKVQTARGATDAESGAAVDLSEGEIKALRSDAGLNQSAGHEANVHAWEVTQGGQEYLRGEKDRLKAIKDEAKVLQAMTNDNNLDEQAQVYLDTLAKGRDK